MGTGEALSKKSDFVNADRIEPARLAKKADCIREDYRGSFRPLVLGKGHPESLDDPIGNALQQRAAATQDLKQDAAIYRDLFEHFRQGMVVFCAANDGEAFACVDLNRAKLRRHIWEVNDDVVQRRNCTTAGCSLTP